MDLFDISALQRNGFAQLKLIRRGVKRCITISLLLSQHVCIYYSLS
jgi:hypothetical protein